MKRKNWPHTTRYSYTWRLLRLRTLFLGDGLEIYYVISNGGMVRWVHVHVWDVQLCTLSGTSSEELAGGADHKCGFSKNLHSSRHANVPRICERESSGTVRNSPALEGADHQASDPLPFQFSIPSEFHTFWGVVSFMPGGSVHACSLSSLWESIWSPTCTWRTHESRLRDMDAAMCCILLLPRRSENRDRYDNRTEIPKRSDHRSMRHGQGGPHTSALHGDTEVHGWKGGVREYEAGGNSEDATAGSRRWAGAVEACTPLPFQGPRQEPLLRKVATGGQIACKWKKYECEAERHLPLVSLEVMATIQRTRRTQAERTRKLWSATSL